MAARIALVVSVVAISLISNESAATPLIDKIVAKYSFDQLASSSQITGTVSDDVGGHNGIIYGGGLNLVNGVKDRAARFDGTNDYFSISGTSAFRNSQYAVSYWVRTPEPQTNGPNTAGFVVSGTYNNATNTSGGGYDIAVYDDNRISTHQFTQPTGNFGGFSQDPLSPGEWHHVVAQWNGSQTQIFVDGGPAEPGGSLGVSGGPSGGIRWTGVPNDHQIYVGAYDGRQPGEPFQGYYLRGDLDELTFFKTALTSGEVQDLYLQERSYLDRSPVSTFASPIPGLQWNFTTDDGKQEGPGCTAGSKCFWSTSEENAWVDADGRLHLRIDERNSQDNTWNVAGVYLTSSEVSTKPSLNYGTYVFGVSSDHTRNDPNAVLGLFTYNTPLGGNSNEIDIELTRWGNVDGHDTHYTVVTPPGPVASGIPPNNPGSSFAGGLLSSGTTQVFTWQPDAINFRSFDGVKNASGTDFSVLGTTRNTNNSSLYASYDYPNDWGTRDQFTFIKEERLEAGEPCDPTLFRDQSRPSYCIPEPLIDDTLRLNFWLSGGNPPTTGPQEAIIDYVLFIPMAELRNSQFSNATSFWTPSGEGSFAAGLDGGNPFGLMTAGSPISISQSINTLNGPMFLSFDYKFLNLSGLLEIYLNGDLLGTLLHPSTIADGWSNFGLSVLDPRYFGLSNALLTFKFDGDHGSQFQIDNIAVYGEPLRSGVYAPSVLPLMLMGLALILFQRRSLF